MYRPYVLQGIVMIVIGFFILVLFVIPYALSDFPTETGLNIVFHTTFAPTGSGFLIIFGAYRIYEGFK